MIRLRSRQLMASVAVLFAAAALTSSPAARADIAAPEYCSPGDSVGEICSTAGPDFDEDGTCQMVACDDGGPCGLLCELAPDGGPITNPPDAGPVGSDDAGPPPDDAGPTHPPSDDAGPTAPPPGHDAGTTTTLPPGYDAGVTTDAGTNANGASSLASESSCSTIGAGVGGQAGGGFFALGALGLLVSAASRRRRKT